MTVLFAYHLFVLKLFSAMSLGGLVGIERQFRRQLAGVRTNALVSMGAASFTLFATALPTQGADSIARVAAQVVSGIGFLGAGVIMRDGLNVRGLTTAATLWCSAAVGVLCGAGMFALALISTLFILGVNLALRPVSRAIDRRRQLSLPVHVVFVSCEESSFKKVKKTINDFVDNQKAEWISFSSSTQENNLISITAKIKGAEKNDIQGNLFQKLGAQEGVFTMEMTRG